MSDEQVTPRALSTEAIDNAAAQYRAQAEQVTGQLTYLDQQRVQLADTLKMLSGAIAALEQVIQNVKDEAERDAAASVAATAFIPDIPDEPQPTQG